MPLPPCSSEVFWQPYQIDKAARARALGQKPFVIWITGLSGAGKSSIANSLEAALLQMGKHAYVLDGDNVRHGLCGDLGFSLEDRRENMRRLIEVARLMLDAGLIVIVAAISPLEAERRKARAAFPSGEFIEVFVDTPIEICEQRDPKGLYAKARAGQIRDFTGVDSPFERPENPDIHLDGACLSPSEMTSRILSELSERGLLSSPSC